MLVGVPKEIKDHEDRVGLIPSSVAELTRHGHTVLVERGAGSGAGLSDDDYRAAGGTLVDGPERIFREAELVVKVKEPLPAERKQLRRGQVLFTYLHLAPDLPQTRELMASGATCIAYETVTAPSGGLPLLTPMSEVAGRMAVQVGAHYLERSHGGRGILIGGVPGVPPGEVIVLGGGVSGTHAATIALGMGAAVTVADRSADALRRLTVQFGARIGTVFSTHDAITQLVRRADLVIGAVLVPGAAAPKLITRDMVKAMKPGAVPRTSTFALNNVTLPFVLALADKGWRAALRADPHLRAGLNVHDGKIYCAPVAEAHGLAAERVEAVLAS